MEDRNRQEQLRAVAANARSGAHEKLADLWWFFLLRGILALVLCIFALFWPDKNVSLLVMAVGVFCLADGAITLFSALRQPAFRENLLQALVVIAIGAVLIVWPDATLRSLLTLMGVAVLFLGASQLLAARRLPEDDPGRGSATKIAIATLLVGAVLLIWPGSGVAVISWVIGIAALLIGTLLIFLGYQFRRLSNRVEAPVGETPGA